jgi:hypothetical protein
MVNCAQNDKEVEGIRRSLIKGWSNGSEKFVSQSAVRLKLDHT